MKPYQLTHYHPFTPISQILFIHPFPALLNLTSNHSHINCSYPSPLHCHLLAPISQISFIMYTPISIPIKHHIHSFSHKNSQPISIISTHQYPITHSISTQLPIPFPSIPTHFYLITHSISTHFQSIEHSLQPIPTHFHLITHSIYVLSHPIPIPLIHLQLIPTHSHSPIHFPLIPTHLQYLPIYFPPIPTHSHTLHPFPAHSHPFLLNYSLHYIHSHPIPIQIPIIFPPISTQSPIPSL